MSEILTVIGLSNSLCEGKETDEEKVNAISDWITANIKYDKEVAEKMKTFQGYSVYSSRTLDTKKGICIDFAFLFWDMLRRQNISAQIISGHFLGRTFIHAWNKVLLNDEWKLYDLTFKAGGYFVDPKNYVEDKVIK